MQVHSSPLVSPYPISLHDNSGFEPLDPPEDSWHAPLSPVQRGPLGFYKSRFIYSPGPWALPGIYRFLSGPVSGGNANRTGTEKELPVLISQSLPFIPRSPGPGATASCLRTCSELDSQPGRQFQGNSKTADSSRLKTRASLAEALWERDQG